MNLKPSTGRSFLKKISFSSQDTMLILLKPTRWESTNSLLTLQKNLKPYFWDKFHQFQEPKFQSKIQKIFQTLISTGLQKVELQELRTKDNADHAGLSQRSHHASHGLYCRKKQQIFRNNNWLIVQAHMEIMAAMVVHEKEG